MARSDRAHLVFGLNDLSSHYLITDIKEALTTNAKRLPLQDTVHDFRQLVNHWSRGFANAPEHLLPSFGASNEGNLYGAAFQSALYLDKIRTMKVLFVCTANKLRSPTAESVFSAWDGVDAVSAGTSPECPRPLTKELVASADVIFVMETHHRERVRKKFKKRPEDSRIITLHILDEYERDDPVLVALLEEKVGDRLKALLADQA